MSIEAKKLAIQAAVDAFSAIQNKHSEVGACDSEVSHERVQVMVDAINRREFRTRTVDGWQLYSSMPQKQTRPAVAQLNTAGKRLHKMIATAPLSTIDWIREYYGIDF